MTRLFTLTLGTDDFILQLDHSIGKPAYQQLGDSIVTRLAREGIAVLPSNDECDPTLGKYVYGVRGPQWKLTVATTLKEALPVWFAEDEISLRTIGLK